MNSLVRITGAIAVLLSVCVPWKIMASPASPSAEFIGSTPCDPGVREFIGGLPPDAPCHCITWKLTFSTNQNTATSGTYNLVAQYKIPARTNPNQSEDGPQVAARGTFKVFSDTNETIYRLNSGKSSLAFARLCDGLLHLMNPDGSLVTGTGGWSFTLNRADRAEKVVEPSLATTAPDMSYKIAPLAKGPDVFGVFEGRSPCHGIARELNLPQHPGCTKVKWRVTLYHDATRRTGDSPSPHADKRPTNYKVEGSLHRQQPREGTWTIVRGTKMNPDATVYRLEASDSEGPLLLWKGDDNVLFFLNQKGEPLIGHADFSYTLNRVPAAK